jgi:hypothetical protein
MRRHRLPASVPININISEAHSRQNLALRIRRRRQSADEAEVPLNLRAHLRQFIVHRSMLGGFGQGCIAILQRSVRSRVFKLRGQQATQCSGVALLQRLRPHLLVLDKRAPVFRLTSLTRCRISRRAQQQKPHPRTFHSRLRSTECEPPIITCPRFDHENFQPLGSIVRSGIAQGLPRVAILFLYTNSPGQLHYTFAYFLCGSTCEEQIAEGPGEGRTGAETAVPGSRHRISNQIELKRGETWQPLTRK